LRFRERYPASAGLNRADPVEGAARGFGLSEPVRAVWPEAVMSERLGPERDEQ